MTQSRDEQSNLSRVLDVLVAILRTDITTLILKVAPLVRHLFNRPQGIYEVLDFDVQLELCDPKGREAIYSKRERVRFLQDNVIAFQDQAWGDGEIFADYKCSPGIAVDRYREGYRYRILISLRQTKNRGDVETFHIERRIKNGWIKPDGSLQTNIDHKMEKVSVSIVFPPARQPHDIHLVEQHAERTTQLGADHIRLLPNRKWLIEWGMEKPRRYESYIIRWKW